MHASGSFTHIVHISTHELGEEALHAIRLGNRSAPIIATRHVTLAIFNHVIMDLGVFFGGGEITFKALKEKHLCPNFRFDLITLHHTVRSFAVDLMQCSADAA